MKRHDPFGHDGFDDGGWGDGINRNPRYDRNPPEADPFVVLFFIAVGAIALFLAKACS